MWKISRAWRLKATKSKNKEHADIECVSIDQHAHELQIMQKLIIAPIVHCVPQFRDRISAVEGAAVAMASRISIPSDFGDRADYLGDRIVNRVSITMHRCAYMLAALVFTLSIFCFFDVYFRQVVPSSCYLVRRTSQGKVIMINRLLALLTNTAPSYTLLRTLCTLFAFISSRRLLP